MKLTKLNGMKIYINPNIVQHVSEEIQGSEIGTKILIREDVSYISSTPKGEISYVVKENINEVVAQMERARNLRFGAAAQHGINAQFNSGNSINHGGGSISSQNNPNQIQGDGMGDMVTLGLVAAGAAYMANSWGEENAVNTEVNDNDAGVGIDQQDGFESGSGGSDFGGMSGMGDD